MSDIVIGLIAASLGWFVWSGIRQWRHFKAGTALTRRIREETDTLYTTYSHDLRVEVLNLNGKRSRWTPFVLAVTPLQITIYHVPPNQSLSLTPDQLRWFGRPHIYRSGRNEIWLHAEIDERWILIKLWLSREEMQALVRTLKAVATPDQVLAYRRRRPYIHYGPVTVHPATQNMLGEWGLADPVTLYLTPLYLVILEGTIVRRTMALDTIQGVSAVQRMDQPGEDGLVCFEANGEPMAFALKSYEAFATLLGDAARRTLEDPVQWVQRKKKKTGGLEDRLYDEDEIDDEDGEGSDPDSYIGYDQQTRTDKDFS